MPTSVVERTLLEMGFDKEMVATAVQLTGGDAEQSVALLFEWGCGEHQLEKPAASAWELPGDKQPPPALPQPAKSSGAAEPEPEPQAGQLWWDEPDTTSQPVAPAPSGQPPQGLSRAQRKNKKKRERKRGGGGGDQHAVPGSGASCQLAPSVTSADGPVIVWLRNDLRLRDNPALHAASLTGRPVIPVFVHAPDSEEGGWPLGGAVKLWLHHSLASLNKSLNTHCGSRLILRDARTVGTAAAVAAIAHEVGASAVHFNRVYEPWKVDRDAEITASLRRSGVRVESFAASVLYEPQVVKPDEDEDSLQKGFASVGFWTAAARKHGDPPEPVPSVADNGALCVPAVWPHCVHLSALELATPPRRRRMRDGGYSKGLHPLRELCDVDFNGNVLWAAPILSRWQVGEDGARAALARFLKEGVQQFEGDERFRADQSNTAEISPYMRFGELSPREVYAAASALHGRERSHTFLRRLSWRDLTYWMLWRFPTLPLKGFRPHYDTQRWTLDPDGKLLKAWQQGQTGYPLVDAAMTQLWKTGWMPNYMRHVTAGFLVEFLGLDWRAGERWYHDTLVDADVAINAYMWQNGGHSGPDQWNFVMHPVFNAKKSDPEGDYVRRWLPQLSRLPVEYIHCPWEAPPSLLASAGVRLGTHYPRRVIMDLEQARINTHRAVMEVRSSRLGRHHRSKNGAEWIEVNGRKVYLVTRVDYREGSLLPLSDVPDDGAGGGTVPGGKKGGGHRQGGKTKGGGKNAAAVASVSSRSDFRKEIKTTQTAAQRWNMKERLNRSDPRQMAMQDCMAAAQYQR
jgi:deoxyribodipyrimidine photolyase